MPPSAEVRSRLRRRGKRLLVMAVVFALLMLAATRQNDVLSCQRQQHPREVLRTFIHSEAVFQRALGKFDSAADKSKRRVTLGGRSLLMTRAQLRDWVAVQWDRDGLLVKPPDCGGIFPTDT